ncbi:MAG: thiamine phosphate synthase [Acidobacteria bacterium]|nr:thiamine phosphate synthase [Acidobacteriota bacterium]
MALLYYITDRCQLPANGGTPVETLKDKVRAAFAAGVDYVQVREKDLEAGALAALVEELAGIRAATARERWRYPSRDSNGAVAISGPQQSRLLVNDRLDVARTCGADGLHLPADSLPAAVVRKYVGKDWIVGVACHSAEEVELAAEAGADYVMVAPVFDTASKPGMTPMGLAAFAAICRRSPIPVFALGGVSAENARSCLDAGATGLAGIRLFQQSSDLSSLCDQLRSL